MNAAFGKSAYSNYYELVERVEKLAEVKRESNEETFKERSNFWSTLKQRQKGQR